ncbi:hypothetical protein B6N60_00301 [Richelia sinica FACHB-800]|uniref:Uncharacterized protein n=1 Tax=Richelia sinica FACHB-800 TaxID=1357546 RepID=A0A975T3Z6_9NOST|nr:hypothetical protein B6N60_00301 [Richelia sinica FACHB-800]
MQELQNNSKEEDRSSGVQELQNHLFNAIAAESLHF